MGPKRGRKRRAKDPDDAAARLGGNGTGRFRVSSCVREDHGQHLYCVAMNRVHPNHADVFATVGGKRASVYRLEPDGNMRLLQAYEDENDDESYFACAWCSSRRSDAALLAVAGQTGVVRVIDATRERVFRDMRGHGNSVNDILPHPFAPYLLLSASKDASCRLWNVDNGVCVCVFGGSGGHRNEALTVDFKLTDPRGIDGRPVQDIVFASGAMDNHVKVWSTAGYTHLVARSETCGDEPDDAQRFPTAHVQTPLFSSFRVHDNYVDCVRWFGDLLLSKSVDQAVTVWQPEYAEATWDDGAKTFPRRAVARGKVGSEFRVLQRCAVKHSDIWFLRFGLDVASGTLACGNRTGHVHLWKIDVSPPALVAQLGDRNCKTAVRQTEISPDGKTVLAACDGGTLWRWDFVDRDALANATVGGAVEEKEDKEDVVIIDEDKVDVVVIDD